MIVLRESGLMRKQVVTVEMVRKHMVKTTCYKNICSLIIIITNNCKDLDNTDQNEVRSSTYEINAGNYLGTLCCGSPTTTTNGVLRPSWMRHPCTFLLRRYRHEYWNWNWSEESEPTFQVRDWLGRI
jgi:hypothetical protein